jgi:hypothetical protein
MKQASGVILGLSLLLTSTIVFASSGNVSIWDTDVAGVVQSGTDAINLKDDLGLRDKRVTQFGLDLNLLGPKGYVRYYNVDNKGNATTTRTFEYGDQQFSNAVPISSQLEQTVVDVGAAKSIVKSDGLQVDLLGGLKYMDLGATIKDTDSGEKTSNSVVAVVPTIGIGAQTHIGGGVHAKASISGLDISIDGKKVDTYDLKYGLEYKSGANVAIGAGIQKSKVLAEDGDVKGDLRRDGNYFEVVVKF